MSQAPLAALRGVTLRYGERLALDGVDLDLPGGCQVGLIGPDGVGKSSLLALVAGVRKIQAGTVHTLGADLGDARARRRVLPRIAYMPQGLGRNLYPTLSVAENLDFFARLFGHARAERARRIADLTAATGLGAFTARPAGKLSGGMRQKLGLCCALIHDPDLLILDEPTTGVDPLSRRQFWELIGRIRAGRPGLSVLVATAYMEEAARFDQLVAMHAGRVLAQGSPAELLARTRAPTLEAAFVALLRPALRGERSAFTLPPLPAQAQRDTVLEAQSLTRRFGDFVAVDRVSFRIRRGEIFGFIGSNGSGKTTTMKMLTGLLEPSEGRALLLGQPLAARDLATRRRVGYVTQTFSLYAELSVRQNLALHGRLYGMAPAAIPARVAELLARFGLEAAADALPETLPLGVRQRLQLAVALIHRPELLILDEPTSGVDPLARDALWRHLAELSRRDGVTIFVSTHFMNEAERCDRVSLMHAGRVLAVGTPAELRAARGAATLEDAFIACIEEADPGARAAAPAAPTAAPGAPGASGVPGAPGVFSTRRLLSHARREALELRRDPIRLTLALLGSAILMFVMGYGISLDVEDLAFAVLDRDQTTVSRDYVLDMAGSRYFSEHAPLTGHAELERRMRSGELSLALEIPPGFARDLARGRPVEIGAWLDGAMPTRAETARGYVQGMHAHWLARRAREAGRADALAAPARIETRFRYNPDVESLPAMVPAVIPLLLMLIPAMLAALAVVREKELGSIVNFYVTPTTRVEFLVGKQLPYVVLSFLSFVLLTALAVTVFGVPVAGSFATLAAGAVLYVGAATALGLLISTFMRSQIAALFGTAVLTLLPAVSFSGMIDPVSSLQGAGRLIGEIYPTTHFLTIARGTFNKALAYPDLRGAFAALALAVPVLLAAAVALTRKQER